MKQYPNGHWYDPPELPWKDFQMVLCDGPPRSGANRNILWEFAQQNGCSPKAILIDDAHREGQYMPPGYSCELKGSLRKFAVGLR
jgi:hypothetical protein